MNEGLKSDVGADMNCEAGQRVSLCETYNNYQRFDYDHLPYACSQCDMRYGHVSHLQMHSLVHNSERRFMCTMCNKRYAREASLLKHEQTHACERTYACTKCDKRFTTALHLSKHKHVHVSERPYVCKYCDKRFTQVASLREHERIHTGARPYACKKCTKVFISSSKLRKHERVHAVEDIPETEINKEILPPAGISMEDFLIIPSTSNKSSVRLVTSSISLQRANSNVLLYPHMPLHQKLQQKEAYIKKPQVIPLYNNVLVN